MKIDTNELLKEKLETLKNEINESKYKQATLLSSYQIRASDFIGDAEGVFIAEFFEGVLSNLHEVYDNYEVDENLFTSINNELSTLINLIQDCLPIDSTKKKADIYDNMAKVRNNITKLQLECHREEWESKKGRGPLSPDILEKIIGR